MVPAVDRMESRDLLTTGLGLVTSPTVNGNGTASGMSGTVTVVAAAPSLKIGFATVTEGDTGTVNADFTVRLSAASTQTVTVYYFTVDATARAGSDYTAVAGTLTFAPGQTQKTITVAVLGDTLEEPNETFFVKLTAATNATIARGQGVGTITDNDPTPSLAINNVTVTEGNTGTVNPHFTGRHRHAQRPLHGPTPARSMPTLISHRPPSPRALGVAPSR